MQLHQFQPTHLRKSKKRIGRGGKRGTYSGRGIKGQKAHSGKGIKPGFRGGSTVLWKLLPKKRGASKKLSIKKPGFQPRRKRPAIVNLDSISRYFQSGETVSPETLLQKGLIETRKHGVKILARGKLKSKVIFKDVLLSAAVKSLQ